MAIVYRTLTIPAVAVVAVLALFGTTPVMSQTSDPDGDPSAATKVQKWTQKQWSEMTEDWRRDRSKWDDCTKQAAAQKLKGQEVWTYIYGCMKS